MANPPPPRMPPPPKKPLAPWRVKAGRAIPGLLVLLVTSLLVQVFFAGLALMGGGQYDIAIHKTFAHVIEMLPLILLVVGFLGNDRTAGVVGVVLVILMQAQYAFLYAAPDSDILRALHPTNGVAMLVLSTVLLVRRWPAPAPQA